MDRRQFRADLLLLIAAAIWGFAFVAQRAGMQHVGPFTFNAVRFALGTLALLPVLYFRQRRSGAAPVAGASNATADKGAMIRGGAAAGLLLFAGSSLQQMGIVSTTAGKAGFITGLYVIIVPILGLTWGQRAGRGTWLGAILALIGLYLLSVTESFSIVKGDVLVLAGAFFWAGHVHLIGRLSALHDPLRVACLQYVACSLLSLVAALFFEKIAAAAVERALLPILYAGIMSVGIAFTLQVVAQRRAPPAHAAIILSLEAVFAVLGGWLILHEGLTARGLIGCAFMLAGMLASQGQALRSRGSREVRPH